MQGLKILSQKMVEFGVKMTSSSNSNIDFDIWHFDPKSMGILS